jgi:hypothetical protein
MVSSTASASSQDLADCLSYSWMMSQFHYAGITQLISRYLYHIKNVSYRDYYDSFYQALKHDSIGSNLVNTVEEILQNYMVYGEVPKNEKWGNVVALTLPESYGSGIVFQNKDHFIKLGLAVANKFADVNSSIVELQYAFTKIINQEYPYIINSTIDIDRWEVVDCSYEIVDRKAVSHMHDQMYQKYLLKTDIKNITNPYVEKYIEDTYKGQKVATIPIYPMPSTVLEGRVM